MKNSTNTDIKIDESKTFLTALKNIIIFPFFKFIPILIFTNNTAAISDGSYNININCYAYMSFLLIINCIESILFSNGILKEYQSQIIKQYKNRKNIIIAILMYLSYLAILILSNYSNYEQIAIVLTILSIVIPVLSLTIQTLELLKMKPVKSKI